MDCFCRTVNHSKLLESISNARWFSQTDQFESTDDALSFFDCVINERWNWLPTARGSAPDPVHGRLAITLRELGLKEQCKIVVKQAVKAVTKSLWEFDAQTPMLVVGSEDLTPLAKKMASYAARMAALEILIKQPDFWCLAIQYYVDGFWPCAITDAGILVVR